VHGAAAEDFLHPSLFRPFRDSVFTTCDSLFALNASRPERNLPWNLHKIASHQFEPLDLREIECMVPPRMIFYTRVCLGRLGPQFLLRAIAYLL
jgi:hypothetical protein